MDLNENEIVKIWKETAEVLNGEFSMPIQRITGGSAAGGVYLFRIDFKLFEVPVRIHTGLYEFPLRKNEYKDFQITITASKEKRERVELSIWRKDFFDKLRLSVIRTNFKEFDKIIGIKPSKNIERELSTIFKNEDLRNELIKDKFRSYNLRTMDNSVIFERKSAIKIKDSNMIIRELNTFSLFIKGLKNANVF